MCQSPHIAHLQNQRIQPVVLRNGPEIADPLGVVLGFLDRWHFEVGPASDFASFAESDLRRANRGGARISAAQIGAILGRRRAIERALKAIDADASLAGAETSIPWLPLRRLFDRGRESQAVEALRVEHRAAPTRRDAHETDLEIEVRQQPVAPLVEEPDEAARDIAEPDERQISAHRMR